MLSFTLPIKFMVNADGRPRQYNNSPKSTEYNKVMARSEEQTEKPTWSERGKRLLRGAAVVGAVAVGAAVVF